MSSLEECWDYEAGKRTFEHFRTARKLTERAFEKTLEGVQRAFFRGDEDVLEIGSGLGYLREKWPASFRGTWTHVEAQPAFLREVHQAFPTDHCYTASAYHLPFRDHSFNVVVGLCSFDVFNNLEHAVGEGHRVLRPGGQLMHLMDLGPDSSVIQEDLNKQKIPCMVAGKSEGPHAFLSGSTNHLKTHYIPPENIPAFLQHIGMPQREFDALPTSEGAFFGLDHFTKKIYPLLDELPMAERFEAEDQARERYHQLFDQYARELDERHYFEDKLTSTLQHYFGEEHVVRELLHCQYTGQRTLFQRNNYPRYFYFERDQGHPRAGLTWGQYFSWLFNPFLNEPKVKEVSIVSCVRARKV